MDNNADFHRFHLQQIPQLFAAGGGVSAVLASRELEPLCLRLADSDEAYSYHPRAQRIDIIAGTEAPLLHLLPAVRWSEFVKKPQWVAGNAAIKPPQYSSILTADFDAQLLARWQQVLQLLYEAIVSGNRLN